MNTDTLLTNVRALWSWLAGLPADRITAIVSWLVPAVLVLFIVVSLRAKRPDRRISTLATVIGLAWSAQGMFHAAVHRYGVAVELAAVLFLLFECFLIANMLRAEHYRTDLARRAKPTQFVWGIAVVMGVVVALAEGWAQSPLRLSVPLLVAVNWYIELTADDDPADKLRTTWRITPRWLGLHLGLLTATAEDAETVDRDHLRQRMTLLAFRMNNSPEWLNTTLRRGYRLNLAETTATDDDIAEVRARLSRTGRVLAEQVPAADDRPAPDAGPPALPIPPMVELPAPPRPLIGANPVPSRRRPGNVTAAVVDGKTLTGDDLRDHFVERLRRSVTEATPRGMTTKELIDSYDGQIGERIAQEWARHARADLRTNGARVAG